VFEAKEGLVVEVFQLAGRFFQLGLEALALLAAGLVPQLYQAFQVAR